MADLRGNNYTMKLMKCTVCIVCGGWMRGGGVRCNEVRCDVMHTQGCFNNWLRMRIDAHAETHGTQETQGCCVRTALSCMHHITTTTSPIPSALSHTSTPLPSIFVSCLFTLKRFIHHLNIISFIFVIVCDSISSPFVEASSY